ncbi:MAG: 50S ribosomal protein L1 [Deltaproteobacteria bacterium]|nr:50S ribosomal protein L1 [Deltaproteobacteria bacterium]
MQAALSIETIKRRHGKRYAASYSKIRETLPTIESSVPFAKAFEVLTSTTKAKFDESVEVSIRLGVDPTQSDQMIRGAVTLPHGLGKKSVIVVFAKGEKAKEATAAGADFVGADDLIEKINGGWQDFTSVVATPDMMGTVSKLGRVLGPRGLMPNPKVGTVTFDLAKTIPEMKKGRAEFRVEKAGVVQTSVGKFSFGAEKLVENFNSLMEQIMRAKPASLKGHYILSIFISSTMGPGIRVDHQEFLTK